MDQQRQEARRELEDRFEVRLAGEGGQGMILAGVILAEAAAVYDGLNAVQTQSYGPEARGGASRSEVIIARGEIDYPKVMAADLLLCMSQEACDKFYTQVKDDGCIIVDSTHVRPRTNPSGHRRAHHPHRQGGHRPAHHGQHRRPGPGQRPDRKWSRRRRWNRRSASGCRPALRR